MNTQSSPLMAALEQFDATEANLAKAERLWADMSAKLPGGLNFGSDADFDQLARSFQLVVQALPAIDGYRPDDSTPTPNEVAQANFDAVELGEPYGYVAASDLAEEPARQLADYRFRLQTKRRALVRDALIRLIDLVDNDLRVLAETHSEREAHHRIPDEELADIRDRIGQIEVLIGSNKRPIRWSDLRRHLHFGMVTDLQDILRVDWPDAKTNLRGGLYGDSEPIPVEVKDLADLVNARPVGPVSQKLKWENLTAEQFERVIFVLISSTGGYENPEWLMQTNAPDRGRDLSVMRVSSDTLSGTTRRRVIIQCKH